MNLWTIAARIAARRRRRRRARGFAPRARAADTMVATTLSRRLEEAQRSFLLPVAKREIKGDVTLTVSQAVDTLARITAARTTPPFDAIIMDEGPIARRSTSTCSRPCPRTRSRTSPRCRPSSSTSRAWVPSSRRR